MEVLTQQWPWYVAGPIIALVMFSLLFFGERFGMSSNLRTMCSIGGAGKFADFFKIDTKKQYWNLAFVLGSILGGFLAIRFLTPETVIEIFGMERLSSLPGILLLLVGGLLIGFGTRYAGGCTSGHAISGLSNLQIPSLIAVIGFFIGGLVMVHLLMPLIF